MRAGENVKLMIIFCSSGGGNDSFCGEGTITQPLELPLVLNHTYDTSGSYDFRLLFHSPFTAQTVVAKSFAVSSRDCSQPQLSIGG